MTYLEKQRCQEQIFVQVLYKILILGKKFREEIYYEITKFGHSNLKCDSSYNGFFYCHKIKVSNEKLFD